MNVICGLDVELVKTDGSCVDDVIATASLWHQRRYELMYADCLSFRFDREDRSGKVGSRLFVDLGDYFQLAGHYHDFNIIQEHRRVDDPIERISGQVQRGNPVLIFVDSFYIPWDPQYLTVHYDKHIVLVTGVDQAEKEWICADPYFTKKGLRLPFELFDQSYRDLITIDKKSGTERTAESIVAELAAKLKEYAAGGAPFKAMNAFADEVSSLDYGKETEGCDNFSLTPLFENLGRVMRGRANYAKLLSYLAECHSLQGVRNAADQLSAVADRWGSIRGTFTKLRLLGERGMDAYAATMERTITNIRNAAVEEAVLVGELIGILGNHASFTGQDKDFIQEADEAGIEQADSGEIEFVDLSGLFNNRAFENDAGTADFDGEGYYFPSGGSEPPNPLQVGDMRFLLATDGDRPHDNVTCLGQAVQPTADRYRALMLLGACEFGSYREPVSAVYEDGTTDELRFGFSDWWRHSPMNGETEAWLALAVQRGVGTVSADVRLYALKLKLNREKRLERLLLPEMPNIHLFAISLEK